MSYPTWSLNGVPAASPFTITSVDPLPPPRDDIDYSGARITSFEWIDTPNPHDLAGVLAWVAKYGERRAEAEIDLPTGPDGDLQRYRARAKANGNIVLRPL